MERTSQADALLAWYEELTYQRVKIVGDFAGKELFAIHGDSLLLHCIAQAQVDFTDGFQLLHAVYAVESLLFNLKQRGCNFHIVWFRVDEPLCVPTEASGSTSNIYHLTRAVLIQHFRHQDSSNPSSETVQYEFDDIDCMEARKYLASYAHYFWLCLDGISFDQCSLSISILYLQFMSKVASLGYSVAHINDLDFVSSKVLASVTSRSFSSLISPLPRFSPRPRLGFQTIEDLAGKQQDKIKAQADWTPSEDLEPLSTREFIGLTAICNTLIADSRPGTRACAMATILQLAALRRCSLAHRSCARTLLSESTEQFLNAFLNHFINFSISIIENLGEVDSAVWDVCDLVDGRIIRQMVHNLASLTMPCAVIREATKFCNRVEQLTGVSVTEFLPKPLAADYQWSAKQTDLASKDNHELAILPFHHPILDDYLDSIQVKTADSSSIESKFDSKVFEELSHWHNALKSIDPKRLAAPSPSWAQRRTQKFMADAIAYSASLTNASGKNIKPETITNNARTRTPTFVSGPILDKKDTCRHKSNKTKKSQKGKQTGVPSGRKSALQEAKKVQDKKSRDSNHAALSKWSQTRDELDEEPDLCKRLVKSLKTCSDLSSAGVSAVDASASLYCCSVLQAMVLEERRSGKLIKSAEMDLYAMIWSRITEMIGKDLDESALEQFQCFARFLQIKLPSACETFTRDKKSAKTSPEVAPLGLSPIEFQLKYCGPYLERSFDPLPDPRVQGFQPDAWQRQVLDAIDANKSLFVVAPTSAGKTFISFYAMKKVLQESDDGVLVYVAPTKALVNQIAAEIQARFSKKYTKGGKSVWAIHSRDYRVNSPQGCQMLVTVPHILQILLLAPSNSVRANSWSRCVKRVIFDEVHCIGQAQEGVIWEQLLLMAPCPIIALSATVGNPQEFKEWLEASEKAKGFDLRMITHSSRYSDLRKYYYRPPSPDFAFAGLLPTSGIPVPVLENGEEQSPFSYIHPIASLFNRHRGSIADISLEPRDCFTLWQCMVKHQTADHPVKEDLKPSTFFPSIVKKSHVAAWEKLLKNLLDSWMRDSSSPFPAVRQELAQAILKVDSSAHRDVSLDGKSGHETFSAKIAVDPNYLCSIVLPLLVDLHNKQALPAILFNYDRDCCEKTLETVLKHLVKAEQFWKKSSLEWAKKINRYETWRKTQAEDARSEKQTSSKGQKKDNQECSKQDKIRDEASKETSSWASFDPEAPIAEFSFANYSKTAAHELEEHIAKLNYAELDEMVIAALRRGIAVHHAGMNRRYRQLVEMLFRKGFLRVVIATGTLALGINMPCKTVVFLGESVYLTTLNYLQAAGRAGRRGFDLLGNVVFAGMPLERVFEIMSSRLPDLRGHFPLSTTLVLRLFGLLHHTENSDFAVRAVKSLLSQTRLYLGGPSDQLAIKHHLRFSIEYLRRQQLLSESGILLNFSGLVGHLYYTEHAVFAFHALLKNGYFHNVCRDFDQRPKSVLLELMLVLSHLFCRYPVRSKGEAWMADIVRKSPSVVLLPRLPARAEEILRNHNCETLSTFRAYVRSYVDQHLKDTPDITLPFTGQVVQPSKQGRDVPLIDTLPPTLLRSPFHALSGFSDDFGSVRELCRTIRSGVYLEESAVPYIPIYPFDTPIPWNAYLYDFFKHGSLQALVDANGIKRGNVWFHLKDFSLILATIVTSLTNFLKLGTILDDADMADVQDADNLGQDLKEASGPQLGTQAQEPPSVTQIRRAPKQVKEEPILENWDDESHSDDPTPAAQGEPGVDGNLQSYHRDTETVWQEGEFGSLRTVLQAFSALQSEFNERFRRVWS
ncbi:hypothetical protein HIM_02993 [Hirsutella minnesotensis 3608]|nr:hypothetical protein HIM_02993 [Hirsutella minnesotensis 3608]